MLRRLDAEDADQLKRLRLTALLDEPTAFGSTHERERTFDDHEWRHRLRPDGNPTFVWERDGEARGMVVASRDAGDPRVVHLLGMWVAPEFRREGIGGALVQRVLEWAGGQGASSVRLHVTSGNRRALSMYERHGFTPTGRSIVRERDGLREIEMERHLRS